MTAFTTQPELLGSFLAISVSGLQEWLSSFLEENLKRFYLTVDYLLFCFLSKWFHTETLK